MMKKTNDIETQKLTQEETHKGKSHKTRPILTKEKVNKSKLGDKLVKAIGPSNQRKAKNKTKKTTIKQVKGQKDPINVKVQRKRKSVGRKEAI